MGSENENSNAGEAQKTTPNASVFHNRLAEAIKGLVYISETDAEFETFVWKPETSAEALLTVNPTLLVQVAEKDQQTPVREQTLADFFRFPTTEQDWHTEEDKAMVRRYQNLKQILEQNLRDPKVFKIGTVEVEIYIVGVDRDGNLAGVKTTAVET